MTDQPALLIPVDSVEFVKELYPRVREDDAAIERYRDAIDRLPPIIVARGRVLVDGFHRWQAHKRERLEQIAAEDLGNLSDVEILKESIRRNASHGRQLETSDKKRMADLLYRQGTRDDTELCELLSLRPSSLAEYLRDARRDEKRQQQELAWDLWLNCWTPEQIAELDAIPETSRTVRNWIEKIQSVGNFQDPPGQTTKDPKKPGYWGNVQHFDIWQFQKAAGESRYFGKMPPQVVENLLWLWTEPGEIIVDLFAGGGTTIDVAKSMGRRVWASDRKPSTPTLPIHQHDACDGWPENAPRKADLVLLDPPYWQQAKGRYSDDENDLANQSLESFYMGWAAVTKAAMEHSGRVAYIIGPTELDDHSAVIDHATEMLAPFLENGWRVERRIIVPYQTEQATGQQVEWARENRKLLKLYRDLVVMAR